MILEKYWLDHKNSFLTRVQQAKDDQELLAQYRMLMEQMKMEALSRFPHDDVLRQQTALLFYEAMQGSEMLLARGLPVVVREEKRKHGKKQPRILTLLTKPEVGYAVLGAGFIFSIFVGKDAWRCAVFFAAAIALAVLNARTAEKESTVLTAVSPLRLEYLDGFITRQSQLLDQHISDLQMLFQDTVSPVTDVSLDAAALTLCQYVWAFSNSNYPAESALYTAEKLLHQNDMKWVEYTPEYRGCFDVMPTQKQSCTVYPALCKISDGTLVSKGQYIETQG